MRNLSRSLILWLCAGAVQADPATTLLQLYEQAITTHPTLKLREYAVDQARAQEDVALSKLLPQVAASGTLSWNEYTQAVNDFRTGKHPYVTSAYEGVRGVVQARQALFDLPSILRYQGAGFQIAQGEQELSAARMSFASDLVENYMAALEASDKLDYIQAEIDLTAGEMARIRRMQERQMATVTDLYEVESYYQSLQTRRIEVENAREVAMERLRQASGLPVKTIAPLARERLPDVSGSPEQWIAEAGTHHPVLQALRFAVAGAEKMIDGARAEHLPQLSLQASEVYSESGGFDNRQAPRYMVGSIGMQLVVPIFSGGGTEAAARDATAKYHMAAARKGEKMLEIEREIRTAYLEARAGRTRMDSTQKEVEARARAREAQQKSYGLGVSTVVALLESKKNELKAKFELAQARYGYIRALLALKLWSGTLGPEDIQEMDSWLSHPERTG